MLAAPQFIKNYGNGSTTGMSIFMVLGWLCGDLFKVIYFYLLRNGSKSITVHCYPVKTCYTLVQFKMTSQFRTRSATSFLGLGRGIVERCFVNGGASFRWSFGPLSVWGSIDATTILTTRPSLVNQNVKRDNLMSQ